MKKKNPPFLSQLTREDQPVDGVEQPPELPVRDVEADGHGPAPGGLDPLNVGRGDVGTFRVFVLKGGKKRGRG